MVMDGAMSKMFVKDPSGTRNVFFRVWVNIVKTFNAGGLSNYDGKLIARTRKMQECSFVQVLVSDQKS